MNLNYYNNKGHYSPKMHNAEYAREEQQKNCELVAMIIWQECNQYPSFNRRAMAIERLNSVRTQCPNQRFVDKIISQGIPINDREIEIQRQANIRLLENDNRGK